MVVSDLEYDLMNYCLKQKGKWWANHFFYNKEVAGIYNDLRHLNCGIVISIINDGSPDYQKHIDFYNDVIKFQWVGKDIIFLQYTGNNKECKEFIGDNYDFTLNYPNINTSAGNMRVNNLDFIVKGIKGGFYLYKPDVFEKILVYTKK